MNKYLSYVIAFCCLVISGVITYHYVVYIPNKNIKTALQECERLANTRHTMETEQFLTGQIGYVSDLKFVYHKDSNQCVYYSKNGPNQDVNESLVDLFTTKMIAFYTESDGKTYGDKQAFKEVYSNYFQKD